MYLDFIVNQLSPLLEEVPLHTSPRLWFLLEGAAPPHANQSINGELSEQFTGRWIGRNSPVQWAERSPDFNKMEPFCGVSLRMKCTKYLQQLGKT